MRPSLLSGLLILTGFASFAPADDGPYDAVVISDEALVRSGQDTEVYATQKLQRGDRVRVIREDRGGWCLIEPPEGSFSWIRADLVDVRQQGRVGVVQEDTMDVIGTELDMGGQELRQRIRRGETVRLINPQPETVILDRGRIEMYRIHPPRGEYRYMERQDLVPADQYVEQPELLTSAGADRQAETSARADPFATSTPSRTAPPKRKNRLPESAAEGVSTPKTSFDPPEPIDPESVALSNEERTALDQAWDRLQQIDLQFRDGVQGDPARWQLSGLRNRYLSLQNQIRHDRFRHQVDKRLAALQRYEDIHAEHARFQAILRGTEERDEQIRESFLARRQTVTTTNPPKTVVRSPRTSRAQNTPPPPAVARNSSPQPIGSRPAAGNSPPEPATRRPTPRPTGSRFDGAGIVQRSALRTKGAPAFVLLAPDGRVLAYLQASPGIRLDQYVGRALGLNGPRRFRPDLNADFLVVRRLTPVRLVR